MDPFFFRVEHDLLRSESFKTLGGLGDQGLPGDRALFADFGTGWAYPSIRTIARQAGLSRQTVLASDRGPGEARPAGVEQVEGGSRPPTRSSARPRSGPGGRRKGESRPRNRPRPS